MGVVIDTSVLVELERQGRDTIPSFGQDETGFLSGIVLSELLDGVLMARTDRARAYRERFLEVVTRELPMLPFAAREAREHARLQVGLRRAGTPIGERDLIIAATALANGHSVMTYNVREFAQVRGLEVLPGPSAG